MSARVHVGDIYGRLTVLERAPDHIQPSGFHKPVWKCQCSCEKKTILLVTSNRLLDKNCPTRSCGCLQKERASEANKTHGETETRLYRIHNAMKQRCLNPKNKYYCNYGGRGITICDAWLIYENFRDWAINHGYSDNLSIDRIDVDGNYEPSNCKWSTFIEQCNNTRNNKFLTFNNETYTMSEWSRMLGLSREMIRSRIRRGWSIEEALTTPEIKKGYRLHES